MITQPTRIRTRTRSRPTVLPWYWENYSGSTASGTSEFMGSYEEMQDWVTPRFSERKGKGEVIMSPMAKLKASLQGQMLANMKYASNPPSNTFWAKSSGPSMWLAYNGWSRTVPVGAYWKGNYRNSIVPPADVSNAQIEACTRARSQIGRSNTDMWENLAEVNKTFDLLKSPIGSWFPWERKVRKVTVGLSAARAWLVYRYGVRPLVLSVNEVLSNLQKKARPTRVTTRANSVVGGTSVLDSFQTSKTYWSDAYHTVQRLRNERVTVRAMSIDEVTSDFEYTYGLASKQLLTLPWELIPWSFVVDWAVNVGDFIGALAQSFYPASLGQCFVTTTEYTESRALLGTTAFNPGTFSILEPGSGTSQMSITWQERSVGLLGPGLVIKQDFRFDQATRLADSLSLIALQISKAFSGRR